MATTPETTDSNREVRHRARRVAGLLAVMLVLNLYDLRRTLQAIEAAGLYEYNPLVNWLVKWLGSPGVVLHKVGFLALGVGLFWACRESRVCPWACAACNMVYAVVACAW